MKKLLFIIPIFFLLSCEPRVIKEGRSIYESYLKDNLKDPNSLIIYNEEIYLPDGEKGGVSEFTVDYGAANSYGGMVRNKVKFYIIGDHVAEVTEL